jgi:hypothetical protein
MKKEYQKLIEDFPTLFKGTKHIGCDVGWCPIINSLCDVIEFHVQNMPIEIQHEFYVAQVKEKFGSLRFYMNQEDSFITGAIAVAEQMTLHTCEVCGQPGKLQHLNWRKTLCEAHYQWALDLEARR